jgi:hypothetical protein
MSFSTYAGLKTNIEAWLARADLTSLVPDFVMLTHKQLMRDLRGHLKLQRRDPEFVLTGEYTAVPPDFLELVSIRPNVAGAAPMVYTANDRVNTLDTDTPTRFSLVAGVESEMFHFSPTPTAGTATIEYYCTLPFFPADTSTNWILNDAPDLYLNGSLFHAYVYLKDAAAAQGVKSLYDYSLNSVMRAGKRTRWGGNGLQVRVG